MTLFFYFGYKLRRTWQKARTDYRWYVDGGPEKLKAHAEYMKRAREERTKEWLLITGRNG